MRLWIRKSDIRNGQRKKAGWCPIALAVRRKYPGSTVSMGVYTLAVDLKWFKSSVKTQNFVLAFDRGEIPNPGYLYFKEYN